MTQSRESTAGDASCQAFLAVDGGNSKTVALVVDENRAVLGSARRSSADIYGATSAEHAVGAVIGVVDAALEAADVSHQDLAAAALRLAGIDFAEDADFWARRLRARYGDVAGWSIKNDAFASLRLIDGSGIGVSITVGTGAAIAARAADGREQCSGAFLFDPLGGAGLGHSALHAACRDWMSSCPSTRLTNALCDHFRVADPYELRHAFVRRFDALPARSLWAASRIVMTLADDGDDVARRLVDDQAHALVAYASWCARRVGLDIDGSGSTVLLNGSIVTSESPRMRDALRSALAIAAPGASITVAEAAPIHGAVLDALAEGGVEITPEIAASVRDEHPQEFLRT